MALILLGGCIVPSDAQIANWPNGHKSAVAITFEVEGNVGEQLLGLTELLRAKGVSATFFVVSGYLQNNPEDLDALSGYEIANMGWHQAQWKDKELTAEFQREQIMRSHTWLVEKGIEPTGFRAPFLEPTPETYEILEELGYSYDSSRHYGFLPYMIGDIVEIPLSVNYDLYWNDRSISYSTMPTYLAFQKSYNEDGLFTFYGHTDTTYAHMKNFSTLLKYMDAQDVWFASCKEIADWWRQKEKLELSIEKDEITIRNNGDSRVERATVKIRGVKNVEGVVFVKRSGGFTYAVLPDIEPQGEVRIRIKK